MSALIEVESLRMHYPQTPVPVLRDLALRVAKGRFVAILGRSGSGKSTLLNLLGAMDKPDSGRVCVGDTDLAMLDEAGRTRFRRRHLGFIFQSFNLLPMLNVRENIALPLALNRRRDPERSKHCSPRWACRRSRNVIPEICPGESNSGSRSVELWSMHHSSSSPMSRPATSISKAAAKCWRFCVN